MNIAKWTWIALLMFIQIGFGLSFLQNNLPFSAVIKKEKALPPNKIQSSPSSAFFVGKYYKFIGHSGTAYFSYMEETKVFDDSDIDPNEISYFAENDTLYIDDGSGEESSGTYSVNEELKRIKLFDDVLEIEFIYSQTPRGMDLAIDTSITLEAAITLVFENFIYHYQEVDADGNELSILSENTSRINIRQSGKKLELTCLHCGNNSHIAAQFFDPIGKLIFVGSGYASNFHIPTQNWKPGLVYYTIFSTDGYQTRGKLLVTP